MNFEFKKQAEALGDAMVEAFHIFALFAIGLTIIWSAVAEYITIIQAGHPSLKDILLLFIYLELLAMVGIYFRTKKLPVVFLIYVALTALTRVLTVDIKTMETMHLLAVSGAILILAIAAMILSFGKPRWLRKDATEEKI
ncbi:MAG: phosphate-starvation-inducible PsiE family protein [Gammaproteobacteria bacterium]|jgi:phosphate starvation-inducible membrane PsiE|nr:phosphate-starvation-inducible PsiE family protein [Gammaproteobacteria bacterium]